MALEEKTICSIVRSGARFRSAIFTRKSEVYVKSVFNPYPLNDYKCMLPFCPSGTWEEEQFEERSGAMFKKYVKCLR